MDLRIIVEIVRAVVLMIVLDVCMFGTAYLLIRYSDKLSYAFHRYGEWAWRISGSKEPYPQLADLDPERIKEAPTTVLFRAMGWFIAVCGVGADVGLWMGVWQKYVH